MSSTYSGIDIGKGSDQPSSVCCAKCYTSINSFEKKLLVWRSNQYSSSLKRPIDSSPSATPKAKRPLLIRVNSNEVCQTPSTPLNVDNTIISGARKSLSFEQHSNPGASTSVPNDEKEPHGVEIPNEQRLPVNSSIFSNEMLPSKTIQSLVRAITTGYISSIACGIEAHCPELISVLAERYLQSKEDAFSSLCRRNENCSVLYKKDYSNMAAFDMSQIWEELVTNHPFLVDVLNLASKNKCSATETPHKVRVKYCLIYSTLMSERWHELSLLQRVNTVLMIEGGGTTRVCST